ncbi:uncharacterized protein LOC6569005 isoform X2 [Drosophila grimshawi]|uniref:uncharacterized protein LOC6569005 isoform X2 n=1 Tax=Drosophila grimshawi TaxID=7222 RepID=UPI000C86EEC7|nr:uncharacterized protein LOC6569005 isoform X2 [Drosophila grimshawi]
MDAASGQGMVIKMAQKNKETQTGKLGGVDWLTSTSNIDGHEPNPMPGISRISWQFFKDREEELYRYACQLKGIRVQREEDGDEEGTSKSKRNSNSKSNSKSSSQKPNQSI